MEQLIFKVPKGTKARLSNLAGQLGDKCSVSDLLRQAVDRFLEERQAGSAYDKAPHLCGCVEMPPDASTSNDYLKQYGDH